MTSWNKFTLYIFLLSGALFLLFFVSCYIGPPPQKDFTDFTPAAVVRYLLFSGFIIIFGFGLITLDMIWTDWEARNWGYTLNAGAATFLGLMAIGFGVLLIISSVLGIFGVI